MAYGIGVEPRACLNSGSFGVPHRRILALVIAAYQNPAAAIGAAGIQRGGGCQGDLIAKHLDFISAIVCRGGNRAADPGFAHVTGQQHPAADVVHPNRFDDA